MYCSFYFNHSYSFSVEWFLSSREKQIKILSNSTFKILIYKLNQTSSILSNKKQQLKSARIYYMPLNLQVFCVIKDV